MKNEVNQKVGRRSIRSVMRSVVAIGATSALMVTGLAFVASSPASAATATQLVFTSEPASTTTAGSASLSFSVTVENNNTPVTSGTGSTDFIAITSSCTLTGNGSPVQAVSGVASFSGIAITTGATCSLTATDQTSPNAGIAGVSTSITVTPTGAIKLGYTPAPPATATISAAMATFKVSIEDQYGNVVTTVGPDSILVSPSAGCTLSATANASTASGVATFTSITFTAGSSSCTLTASDQTGGDTGFTNAVSAVNVASTAPAEVGFTVQPATSVAAGTVLPSFAVSVEQGNGVVVASGTGSIDVINLTSACTLAGTTSVAAIGGVATFTAFTIKTGSSCPLVATDATRALLTATSTAVSVVAGVATQVGFTTAPPTTETTASTILATFKAAVEDVNGNVVTTGTGATDTITITSTCALGGPTAAAAFAGVATFSALSINATGTCVLTAIDSTRTLTTAAHTTSVGTPQPSVTVRTLKGNVGTVLRLAISGGTGTGPVTWTLAAGSSAGCRLSGNALSAGRAGTCSVTATKAGGTTYVAASSPATTVTFVLLFKAYRVIGAVFAGRTTTATITGSGFYGRPKVISNVAGISTRVIRDTGRTLVVVIFVSGGVRPGVHAFTILLANGKRTSMRYSLR